MTLAAVLAFAAIVLPTATWTFALVSTLRMVGALRQLSEGRAFRRQVYPQLSVITPACNEAESIESSLSSMLAGDYPNLQIVAIDDRSTDATGEIIDRVAASDARVVPVHVKELPEGWLGKLNAMAAGVARSTGDWILFADADVMFAPGALEDAVAYAEHEKLDFLTALPDVASAGLLGDAAITSVGAYIAVGRPWAVRDPRSKVFMGIGAFLLVRRAALEKTPGLEWLKLEVADDMGMCLLLKSHGARCDIVRARESLSIRWYSSFGEIVNKMQKNFFAITGRFSLARCVAFALALVWGALFPIALLVPGLPAYTPWIAAAGAAAAIGSSVVYAVWAKRPVLSALLLPLGMLLVAGISVRSGLIGTRIGGIRWRDRFYSTALLRPNQRVKL